jgi:hypothetical protein
LALVWDGRASPGAQRETDVPSIKITAKTELSSCEVTAHHAIADWEQIGDGPWIEVVPGRRLFDGLAAQWT